jgi:group I intron endonuclease
MTGKRHIALLCYCVTNTRNGKRYIGITSQGIGKRWALHKYWARHPNKGGCFALSRAIAKYGAASFNIEAIACASDYGALLDLERVLIAQERTHIRSGHGYNLTLGGQGSLGWVPSEATRQAISARAKGRVMPPRSEAYRAAVSARHKGKDMSPETRARISESKTGKPQNVTPEGRARQRAAIAGRVKSESEREKLRVAATGRTRSEAARQKIRAARAVQPVPPKTKEGCAKLSAQKLAYWEAWRCENGRVKGKKTEAQ